MLTRFNMQSANPVDTPLDCNVVLVANDGYSQSIDRGLYQQLVGSLLYTGDVATRRDPILLMLSPPAAALPATQLLLTSLRLSVCCDICAARLTMDCSTCGLICPARMTCSNNLLVPKWQGI